MEIKDLLDVLETGGLLGLLTLIIIGGAKEWWVYGRHYRDCLADRDEWKQMALAGTELADKAVQQTITVQKDRRRN